MMDEDVASLDLVEERVGIDRRREARMGQREPLLLFEVAAVETHELLQLREVEQALDQIDLRVAHAQPSLESFEHPTRHRARDLDSDDVSKAPPSQFVLHCLEEI